MPLNIICGVSYLEFPEQEIYREIIRDLCDVQDVRDWVRMRDILLRAKAEL